MANIQLVTLKVRNTMGHQLTPSPIDKVDQLFTISIEESVSIERSDKESNHITKVLPTRSLTEKQSVVSVTAECGRRALIGSVGSAMTPESLAQELSVGLSLLFASPRKQRKPSVPGAVSPARKVSTDLPKAHPMRKFSTPVYGSDPSTTITNAKEKSKRKTVSTIVEPIARELVTKDSNREFISKVSVRNVNVAEVVSVKPKAENDRLFLPVPYRKFSSPAPQKVKTPLKRRTGVVEAAPGYSSLVLPVSQHGWMSRYATDLRKGVVRKISWVC